MFFKPPSTSPSPPLLRFLEFRTRVCASLSTSSFDSSTDSYRFSRDGTGKSKDHPFFIHPSIHRECFEDGEVVVGSMEKARWTLRLAGGLFCGKAGRGAHTGTGIARSHEYTVIENQYLHSRGWEYASRILHPATIEIFRPCCAPRPPLPLPR